MSKCRHLLIVLGDQLNLDSALYDEQSPADDLVWMAELPHESIKVWSHKARIVTFLSGMRHFAETLRSASWRVDYLGLGQHPYEGFGEALNHAIKSHQPERVRVVEPGEWNVRQTIASACEARDTPLDIIEDRHFLTTTAMFDEYADGRKNWTMEHFYRLARQRSGYLMNDGKPTGGQWNYDKKNRITFGRQGPGMLVQPRAFPPDRITRSVIELVQQTFPSHPGSLDAFDWPVTREEALLALEDFEEHRLAAFGDYQDAMWTEEPWLYHSRLSAAMNLKLLDPREVIASAIDAYECGHAPLNAVEGFVRQILGWREYVRHLYFRTMPDLLEHNALEAHESLPEFFWNAQTDMHCLRQSLAQTLDCGYAHHIQRLMVIGLFAQLLGVRPKEIHEWFLAVYVDAVEWVEAPNTLGMSQYADGGILGTKPYVASGKYIERMSNYCEDCPYKPSQKTGANACPYTVLYWDFLIRHQARFRHHPRTALQWKNLDRLSEEEQNTISENAKRLRERFKGKTQAVTSNA